MRDSENLKKVAQDMEKSAIKGPLEGSAQGLTSNEQAGATDSSATGREPAGDKPTVRSEEDGEEEDRSEWKDGRTPALMLACLVGWCARVCLKP